MYQIIFIGSYVGSISEIVLETTNLLRAFAAQNLLGKTGFCNIWNKENECYVYPEYDEQTGKWTDQP